MQYRESGRKRRFAIGIHRVWPSETARMEAWVLVGRVARGGDPAEEPRLDDEAITAQIGWDWTISSYGFSEANSPRA